MAGLRISKIKENSRHRRGLNKNNTSGYRNVSWDKRSQDWMVQLQDNDGHNRVWRHFETAIEASKFAEKKRKEFYGEFAGRDGEKKYE
jgi:hypothetical protein